jgi:ubiquinone/menaquinone biosynthesis C-methylase UbiE
MSSQKDAFLAAEADAWFARNRAAGEGAGAPSEVAGLLRRAGAAPTRVLEIGCSNGELLASLCRELGCAGAGVDPSAAAIAQGRERHPQLQLEVATAERLPFADAAFDLVVFGFCLYLCDRADLFRIAAEADRVLADPGWLAITDFQPPFAYRNRYAHREGLYSYKMDYSRMFAWNPAYTECARELRAHGGEGDAPDARMGSVLLRRHGALAWPLEPWSR